MQLVVGDELCDFIDIKTFRAEHNLPDDFGVAYFEPKDYTGLGSIDAAGSALGDLRKAVLASLPVQVHLMEWLEHVPTMQGYFREGLESINRVVNLRDIEMDFAAAGFGDVCRAVVYAMIHARSRQQPPPPFHEIYTAWLYSTVRINAHPFTYKHWQVQVVSHAYGRIGLVMTSRDERCYLLDKNLACPAEGFMQHLLEQVAAHMFTHTV